MATRLGLLLIALLYYPVPWIRRFFCRLGAAPNVLIIDNAKIGDLVCATPVFRAIKEHYPAARLVLLTDSTNLGVLVNNPRLDEIIELKRRSTFRDKIKVFRKILKSKFDVSITLVPGSMNYLLPYVAAIPWRIGTTSPVYSGWFRCLAFLTLTHKKYFMPRQLSVRYFLSLLEPLGIVSTSLRKEVFYQPAAAKAVDQFLSENRVFTEHSFVAMAVTSGNKVKEWPLDKFAKVVEKIYERYGWPSVIIGGPKDGASIDRLRQLVSSRTPLLKANIFSLEQLPALLARAKFFISVDTGPLYIANALDVPVLDIAGPCDIYDQMPIYEKCEVAYVSDLPGWPFSSVLRPAHELKGEAARSITDLTPELVLASFDRLVKRYG